MESKISYARGVECFGTKMDALVIVGGVIMSVQEAFDKYVEKPKNETTSGTAFISTESNVYTATSGLRWVLRQISPQHAPEKILQQLWLGNMGDREWRDVEIVEE